MAIRYQADQIAKCSLDSDGHIVDPITLEVIEPDRLISVFENGKYFCYDIDTLYREISAGRPNNPFTRGPLSWEVLDLIEKYAATLRLNIRVHNILPSIEIDSSSRIGDLLIAVGNEIPNGMGELIYYRVQTPTGEDVFDSPLMNSISTLDFGNDFTLQLTKGNLRRLSHIQALYDYAYSVGRTGMADSLFALYPEITPRQESEEIIGPAAEQQRRIQERHLQAQAEREQRQLRLTNELLDAIRNNDLEQVRRLVSEGAPIIGESDEALRLANELNQPRIVEYLLDASDASRDSIVSLLDLVSQRGPQRQEMQDVLTRYLNRRDEQLDLIRAINRQDLPAVSQFLDQGIDPNFRFSLPLRTALRENNLPVIQLLVERGASLNFYPILTDAIQAGRLDIVRYLVEHGANVYDSEGQALRDAILAFQTQIVDYLYDYMVRHPHQPIGNEPRVDPEEIVEDLANEAEDDIGDARLTQVIINGNLGEMIRLVQEDFANLDNVAQLLGETHPNLLRAAITNGFDVDAENGAALYAAAALNNIQNMMILINAGADVNIDDGIILETAISSGHAGATAILIANGANVTQRDYISSAVEVNNYEIVSLLIDAGANIHANENRAIRLAIEQHYSPIIIALLQADLNNEDVRQIVRDNFGIIDREVLRLIDINV